MFLGDLGLNLKCTLQRMSIFADIPEGLLLDTHPSAGSGSCRSGETLSSHPSWCSFVFLLSPGSGPSGVLAGCDSGHSPGPGESQGLLTRQSLQGPGQCQHLPPSLQGQVSPALQRRVGLQAVRACALLCSSGWLWVCILL